MLAKLRRLNRLYALPFALLLLVLGSGWLAYEWSESSAMLALRQTNQHRLDLFANGLQSEVDRFLYLPSTLELESEIRGVLKQPSSREAREQANVLLEHLNERIGTSALYVMDIHGQTVAASNWRQSDSFVGMSFAYRPYFKDAMSGLRGRFYGVGTTSGTPGHYFSYGIRDGAQIIGVAVAKVSLERLEQSWLNSGDLVMLADSNQVVILSSEANWKFKSLQPLDAGLSSELLANRQYNGRPLLPLDFRVIEDAQGGDRVVSLGKDTPSAHSAPVWQPRYLMQTRHLPATNWHISVLSNLESVRQTAMGYGLLVMVGVGLLAVWLLFLGARQRAVYAELAAKRALQKAHDELEQRVNERTSDLVAANERLHEEIIERERTEIRLRVAQDELVHASKLAVLGQLATGITHELNQPLAALRTLSDNSVKFLQRGDVNTTQANLGMIGELVDRMGHITRQLKLFARKAPLEMQPVDVVQAIANALFLLSERVRRDGVILEQIYPEHLPCAWCDQNRLEQVLVNLLGNALDAMKDKQRRHLSVACRVKVVEADSLTVQTRLTIEVHDEGEGMDDDTLTHLFEPFYTTKAPGIGLGLGLAISAGIIREFGGSLSGANHPQGGAVFTVELPVADEAMTRGHAKVLG